MKTKLILLLVASIFCSNIYAQTETSLQNQGNLNLGLNGFSFSYELPIGKKWVWENAVGIGAGYDIRVNGSSKNTDYNVDLVRPEPYLLTEFKYVYNRAKREEKGKSVLNNAGNYIGFQLKYTFGNKNNINLDPTLLSEAHWGFQTPLGKKFLFDLHLGLGIYSDFTTNDSIFGPTVGAKFSYVLFK